LHQLLIQLVDDEIEVVHVDSSAQVARADEFVAWISYISSGNWK
jgi:hypothetical protein